MCMKFRAIDICYVGLFVAFMMIGANITSLVPFMVIGGVPITLQTFFAILAGALLGSRLGSISMIVYAVVGLVGAPVFAQFGGGIRVLISPTFGFILSFIILSYVVGRIVEKNQQLFTYFIASIIGLVINYLFGTNWMYFAYKLWAAAPDGFTYKMAWLWMVPPLPKDVFLSLFAGWMAHRLHKTIKISSFHSKANIES
ncbi:biotin transporter BioY [Heyndrickxia sporothermodurans]|uniref:biotin transporter BioY n=1 Tax=Heyndrickxia sporothermodurans TaxID=46224 RepID=UPI002E1A23B2|nr:biotin transporter BioY [Heyndrickxia sporothermodurans]MED3697683.1 biotin transporter BioY [Heyndrickxia sporothermodurans]MED3779701.1 biotin transporter BioY [Heyndrickxia sporothermodurans]